MIRSAEAIAATLTALHGDVPLEWARLRIECRIGEKRDEYADYLAHLKMRQREEDLHGCWDASVNAAEVANYIDGLEFALTAIDDAIRTQTAQEAAK